jgi:hypothetical protein
VRLIKKIDTIMVKEKGSTQKQLQSIRANYKKKGKTALKVMYAARDAMKEKAIDAKFIETESRR